MFRVLDEPLSVDYCLGCWAKHMGRFSQVAGHTSFGDVFLLDPDNGQYAVLCPITGERFPTDCHDRETFIKEFLRDPGIIEKFARPADVAELAARLGPLEPEQVYLPAPLPFLGGSMELSTYAKGGLWEFVEMVGLFRGLGGGVEVKVEGSKATIIINREEEEPPASKPRRKKR
jgi:hypothetical protein